MEEPEHVRESNFVNHMVSTLIERYNNKLEEVTPGIDEEAVMRGSGIRGIGPAMDRIEHLLDAVDDAFKAVDVAVEAHRAGLEKFDQKFGEECTALCNEAEEALAKAMHAKRHDFEFRIRRAIGLVELVGGEEAFDVLEGCRWEIERLKG